MAIQQPISSNTLNSPDHSLSHRVVANDNAAPVQSVVVSSTGNVGIGTTGPRVKTEISSTNASATPLGSVVADGGLLLGDGGIVGMVMGTYGAVSGGYPSYIQARNLAGSSLAYNLL